MSQERDFDFPQVGIGIMIFKNGNILMHQRKGSHGEGEYSFPGGHLEKDESFEDCARRETREETGVEINDIKFLFLANVKKYANKHYVHIGLTATWQSGEPKNLEPEKSTNWSWMKIEEVPEPISEMCKLSFESLKTGKNYFDS